MPGPRLLPPRFPVRIMDPGRDAIALYAARASFRTVVEALPMNPLPVKTPGGNPTM